MSKQEWYQQLYGILSEEEIDYADEMDLNFEDYMDDRPMDAAERIRVDIYEYIENMMGHFESWEKYGYR